MPTLNQVNLIGNVGQQPELKYTPKGTAVAEISLAVNRSWKDDAGTKHEETTWVPITFWGRTAEIVGEYAKKGAPIYVGGRLTLDEWDDKQSGQKRSRLKIIGETLQLLGGRPQGSEGTTKRTEAPPRQSAPPTDPMDDSDVTF